MLLLSKKPAATLQRAFCLALKNFPYSFINFPESTCTLSITIL